MFDSADDTTGGYHPPVQRALHTIGTTLEELGEPALWSLSEVTTLDLIVHAQTVNNQLDALRLQLIAHAEATAAVKAIGATSTTRWLTESVLLHPSTAKKLVRTAVSLRTGLRTTAAACAAGTVSAEQAAAISQAITELPGGLSSPAAGEGERILLELAHTANPTTLAAVGVHLLDSIDPELGQVEAARKAEREAARQARTQYLNLSTDPRGGGYLKAHLTSLDFASFRAVIDSLSAPRPSADDGPDTRTSERRRAEALGHAAQLLLGTGTLPAAGKHKPQVLVTVTLDTLRTGLGTAVLDTAQKLTARHARQLACTAGIIPAVLGTGSVPLDVGRTNRFFEGALRRALDLRDGGCAFPSCTMPISYCDGHHVTAWHDDGPTSLSNGCLLCQHHHTVIHHGEWSIVMADDGRPDFHPPAWLDPTRAPRRNTWRLRR